MRSSFFCLQLSNSYYIYMLIYLISCTYTHLLECQHGLLDTPGMLIETSLVQPCGSVGTDVATVPHHLQAGPIFTHLCTKKLVANLSFSLTRTDEGEVSVKHM